MATTAAEIDDRQAVAEKLGVAGEPDQPRGLDRIGDMELGDGATERSVETA